MQSGQSKSQQNDARKCLHIHPSRNVPTIIEDVHSGLFVKPRSLPPKYFYDDRGSELFDQICATSEYYPTRTEDALLLSNSTNIIAEARPDRIIELGSGTSTKTRRLLDACEQLEQKCDYLPFDVCESLLETTATDLTSDYDWLEVMPLLGDYNAGLANMPESDGNQLYVFLGSTIGNFDSTAAGEFVKELRSCMTAGDYFLIGADRIKDENILNAAYNDSEGITAAFNLNVLRVLNQEVGSNFDLNHFQHQACFNSSKKQIEMYLVSLRDQEIHFESEDASIQLEKGERILTEISRKFDKEDIVSLLEEHEMEIVRCYQPDNEYFSLWLARAL
ncbi:MAG: L-histidine N(alpha)-methyltransferase [Gammaproteobacteria bacterium]|nr:L-histidine N(alpha)-methyltransferase [Gammaproteobacteria bacterium]